MNILIQTLPIATAVLEGPEMRLIAANDPMLKLWGRDKSIVGTLLLEFMPELKDQEFPALLREVYYTGKPYHAFDAPVYIRMGEEVKEIFMDFTYSPLDHPERHLRGILVTAVDVTERVRTRRQIQESERNFRSLVTDAPIAMCVLKGPDHIVEIANQRMFELWGKPAENILHKPLFDGLLEGREQGFEEILKGVYITGERYTATELPVRLPRDGKIETRFVTFVYEAFHESDGTISGVIAVANEVTELVQSRHKVEEAEERARLAIEASGTGTFDLNLQSQHLITSDRFNAIFGLSGPGERNEYLQQVHPDDLSVRDRAHEEALKTGRLFFEVRLAGNNVNGKWIRVEGQVHYDANRQPERLLGTVVDITNEKNLQQQKNDFIGIASHELKTPITSLKASMQLLQRSLNNIPPRPAALLNQSVNNLNRLENLMEDLLNVSKLEAGQLSIEKTPFKIKDLVNDCCSHVRAAGEYDIVFKGDEELELYADRFRLDQVLINLVNNAVKYAKDSKVIEVVAVKLPHAVKIAVNDKGPGIPPEKLPHLFERYFQAGSEDRRTAGVGLGLFISSQIIKRHGGQIGVNSEPGKGSSFWFIIPG
ncbi:MAG TPA: ATP-binding protein [Sphingobacteriaceae bacterium]